MKLSKVVIAGIIVTMLGMSGCQSRTQDDYDALQSELSTVKAELIQTKDALRIAKGQIELNKKEAEEEFLKLLGVNEIFNKDEKIETLKSSVEELTVLIQDSYPNDDMSQLMDEFFEQKQQNVINVYFGAGDDVFIRLPSTELPDDYRFTQRPVYKGAIENDIYIAEIYIDIVKNRKIQTISKAVYIDNQLIGVVGIDAHLD